jgi:hypothetical protein
MVRMWHLSSPLVVVFVHEVCEGETKLGYSYNKESRRPDKGIATQNETKGSLAMKKRVLLWQRQTPEKVSKSLGSQENLMVGIGRGLSENLCLTLMN